MLLFCLYMPCDERYVGDNFIEYQDVLSEISYLCKEKDCAYFYIAGDFNTDFNRDTPQTRELVNFCNVENCIPVINLNVSNIDYTYESTSNGARSLIDHVIVSKNLCDVVHRYYTIDSIDNTSDHLPVLCEFIINCEYMAMKKMNVTQNKIAWYKANLHDIKQYKDNLDIKLDDIESVDVFKCENVKCTDKSHQEQLETLHECIVEACLEAARETLPSSGGCNAQSLDHNSQVEKPKVQPLPGFTDFIKEKKETALFWHWAWKDFGKPHQGYYAEMRRLSRAQYHYCIRMVKRNEDMVRSQKMAESIVSGNHKGLWKEAKRLKGSGCRIPKTVDGLSEESEISELFADKFGTLYNSVGYDVDNLESIKNDNDAKIYEGRQNLLNNSKITIMDIVSALKNVKCNKSDGYLGLYSDHIIHGSHKLFEMLTNLYNCMIIHGCCPVDMLTGTLIPIPKNRRSNISCSNNFRAICLQSVLCKLLDIIILCKESNVLITSNGQFGFKKGHSAAMATSVLTETTDYYVNKGGTVYALALDASKAFDRVQYDKLFQLLVDRDLNPLYTRLLMSMYTNQKLRVVFNQDSSDWFSVTNGVKQGGVLSPTLFGVYVDGMLVNLKELGIGCYIGDIFCGALGYADDLMLLVPTIRSLRRMIKVCEKYALDYNIQFNGSKSQLMIFGKGSNELDISIHVCGEKVEVVTEMKYLGFYLSNNVNDSLVKPVINDFNNKVNSFFAYFNNVQSEVKNVLFRQYCSSFYGYQVCAYYHKDIDNLYIAWRKAIRRVWKIPYMTHCKLLPHLSDLWPGKVMFYTRYLKYFLNGLNSDNDMVSTVFRSSLHNMSRMGNNVRKMCFDNDVRLRDLFGMDVNEIGRHIITNWKSTIDEEDVRVGQQIKELCKERDCLGEWLLERGEICDIIEFLCVM